MSESDSDGENKEEKIKIVYNGIEKTIDTPEGYKELLEAFLKVFNTDKDKEYIFSYRDKGKENIIDKNLTTSDFSNIDKIYVKEPKKENENEDADRFIEEVQGTPISDSDRSEDENKDKDEEKIKIVYNGIEKTIDTPEGYKGLSEAFLKAFNTDKDKEYIFFYKDNEKENIIDKNLTSSDFNNIDKIQFKEPKKAKKDENKDESLDEEEKNPLSGVSEVESEEKDDEKTKIVYNGKEKTIDTPENYNGLLEAFLKEFKVDKGKEYIFFYMDNGKENIIDKNLTSSDFNNIDKVFVKGPKKENENEDEGEILEEIEVEKKPIKDPNLSFMSNDNLLQKSSSEVEKKLSSKQDINTETTLNSIKEVNEVQNITDKKSVDKKNEEAINIVKENSADKKDGDKEISDKTSSDKKSSEKIIAVSNINQASLSQKSLDNNSEDKKSVEEDDEYMKIKPEEINDVNKLEKLKKEIIDLNKKLQIQMQKQKKQDSEKVKKEVKKKEDKIQEKDNEIKECKEKVWKNHESELSKLEKDKNNLESIINSMKSNKSKEAEEQIKKNNEKQKDITNLNTKMSDQKDLNVKLKSGIEELSTQKKDLENQLKEWTKKLEDKKRYQKGGDSRIIYDLILPINNSYLENELNKALKKREEKDEKKKTIQLKLSNQFQKKFKKYQKEKTSFNKSDIIEKENTQKKKIFEKYRNKYGKENMDNNIGGNDSGKIDELIEENKDLKNKIKLLKKTKKKKEIKIKQDSNNKEEKDELNNSKKSLEKEINKINNNSECQVNEEEEKERIEKEEREKEEKEKREKEEREEKERKEREEKERKEKEEKERKQKEEREEKEKKEKKEKKKEEEDNFSLFNNSIIINEDAGEAPIISNEKKSNQNNQNCSSQNDVGETSLEYYSYSCQNLISLSSYIYESTESTKIEIQIENDGTLVWPENYVKLKFESNSQIKGEDIILNPQKPKEINKYEIQFNNLGQYKAGTYESYMNCYINEQVYGERMVLKIVINKKAISEVEEHLDKIKEFREMFELNENDYSNEVLYNALKNNDFDMELSFSSLFGT